MPSSAGAGRLLITQSIELVGVGELVHGGAYCTVVICWSSRWVASCSFCPSLVVHSHCSLLRLC